MSESVESAVQRGAAFLIAQQKSDGNFEGRLSSSTFPTCAYAWAQFAQNQVPDGGLIDWFLKNQNGDGTWGLDAANQPNREATLFAKLILAQFAKRNPNPQIAAALARIPEYPLELALMKLAYAAFGEYDWNKLTIPKNMLPLMKLTQQLLTIFPSLRSLLKPPTNVLPPVDLFNTPMFEKLFIAEQHTLVPVFILIELHTAQRPAIIDSLVSWLKSHRLADGSWFRVNYITALSVLALIELQRAQGRTSCQLVSEEIQAMIDRGIEWLQSTRNPDGGCREALNLNVWDTALSVISIIDIGDATWHNEIQSACRWLIENQNSDGGWAFSGLPPPPSTGGNHRLSLGGPPWGTGGLPSDADDTALATLALLRSKIPSAA
ncbi:hypothetical protein HYR99_29940, partial [Candidatus Poribacteria bacterium]|nr:hypothetical protein [Candidatus Poribacteria bacterium]